jgi:hypothetical protein
MARDGKANARIFKRELTRLGGLSAIRFRFEYDSASGRVSEEEIVALRHGIVYVIGFRTGRAYYERDKHIFGQIRLKFGLLSLPQGECSND